MPTIFFRIYFTKQKTFHFIFLRVIQYQFGKMAGKGSMYRRIDGKKQNAGPNDKSNSGKKAGSPAKKSNAVKVQKKTPTSGGNSPSSNSPVEASVAQCAHCKHQASGLPFLASCEHCSHMNGFAAAAVAPTGATFKKSPFPQGTNSSVVPPLGAIPPLPEDNGPNKPTAKKAAGKGQSSAKSGKPAKAQRAIRKLKSMTADEFWQLSQQCSPPEVLQCMTYLSKELNELAFLQRLFERALNQALGTTGKPANGPPQSSPQPKGKASVRSKKKLVGSPAQKSSKKATPKKV